MGVVADGAQHLPAEVDVEQRREVAALHEDVRVVVEDPPVLVGEGRRQRQPHVDDIRPPGIEPEPVEDPPGRDLAEPEAAVREALRGARASARPARDAKAAGAGGS